MHFSTTTIGTPRRWAMLAVSVLAQTATAISVHGPAFLIPTLHRAEGLSLTQAAVVAAAPSFGVMFSLVPWGFVVDRRGERFALLVGLVGTTAAGLVATRMHGPVALSVTLFVAGLFAASSNSASGRVVVGWFPVHRRGLAMGIRQMAQPLGVGIAAISLAVLAERHGIPVALTVPWVAAGVATVAVWLTVVDPPRPPHPDGTAPNPYRQSRYLARIHGASVLLVVPQFVVWTFALVWLVESRGWSAGAAGALVASSQIVGALGRIAVGQLSDKVASRMRPLRWVAIAAAVTMGALALAARLDWALAVPLMVLATTVTVADNGLAFTGVAERAGPFWSGRALGVQNTAQFLTAAISAPVAGATITAWGYPVAFGIAALFPVLAVGLVPQSDEQVVS